VKVGLYFMWESYFKDKMSWEYFYHVAKPFEGKAKRDGYLAVNEKGRAVYKSLAKRKGKEVTVYRDSKGRFAKAPVITYAGSYER